MKQKDFIFNIAILIFLNLLIKPFWILGVDIGVQNQVGAEDYGFYFAILNFTFLLNMLLDMGITNFNNRNIAQNTQLFSKHISGILSLKIALGAVYILVSLLLGLIIGYDWVHLSFLLIIAFNQFLNAMILYLRSNISALLMFKTDSILSVLDRLLMICFCSYLLWLAPNKENFTIHWYVYAQTASYLCALFVAFLVVFKKADFLHLTWNFTFFRAILKQSFPFALLYLLMSLYCRIDAVMIERLLPAEIGAYQTGIYASAFRLLDAVVMIAYLFSVILLPLFSKMLKEKENVLPIVKSSFALIFFFAVTTISLLSFNKTEVLSLLYHDHVAESAKVFQILFPSLLPIALAYIFGTLLTANGNLKLLNICALVGIGVNLIVNFILIPKYGAAGAAVASLFTQITVTTVQIIIATRQLKISLLKLPIVSSFLFTIIIIPAYYFLSKVEVLGVIQILMLGVILALSVGIATKLIPLNFLVDMLKRVKAK